MVTRLRIAMLALEVATVVVASLHSHFFGIQEMAPVYITGGAMIIAYNTARRNLHEPKRT